MSVWDTYEALAGVRGVTRRDTRLRREKRYLTTKLPDNLSYFSVTIDGVNQEVAIINSDNLDEKYIYSMPGENFNQGGMVYWMDCYWLIEEKDANNEIYTRGKLLQCNYLLKWVDESGIIREQWCHVEDGTKYLTGEFEDRQFIVTRGDSRIAITIQRNEFTKKFNRTTRLLIDEVDNGGMMAFTNSKPLKVGRSYYDEGGIYKFVMQEVNSSEDDNFELGIADYYRYFPHEDEPKVEEYITPGEEISEDTGKKRWL